MDIQDEENEDSARSRQYSARRQDEAILSERMAQLKRTRSGYKPGINEEEK